MKALRGLLIFAVRLYRWTLSPLKLAVFGSAARCRFRPTCSEYALQALQRHGALSGSWLSLKRICRCHPWGGCGEDAVPDVERRNSEDNDSDMRGINTESLTASAAHDPSEPGEGWI